MAGVTWRLWIALFVPLVVSGQASRLTKFEAGQRARAIASRDNDHCVLRLEQRSVKFDPRDREDLRRLDHIVRLELGEEASEHDLPNQRASEKRFHRGLREIRRLTEDFLDCKEGRGVPVTNNARGSRDGGQQPATTAYS